MAGRRGGEGIRDGDLAGKRETEKTRGRRKRIRTTSTPRFLATAMTVLRVPKSTPVGWETQGLGQPRTRIWLCDVPPKEDRDRHSTERLARGNRKNSPTTLMISVGGVCPGTRAHWQKRYTEEEKKCTGSRGAGAGELQSRRGDVGWRVKKVFGLGCFFVE